MRRAFILSSILVLSAVAACGGSDSPGPTPQSPRQDSASTVVGSGGGLVVTPNGDAGVQIPPGVLGQNATITVAKLPTPGTPGQGPLPTSLNQYGPYYEISISPANTQLGDSVRVGVCQVTNPSSPFYAPEVIHDQLRLAHTVAGATEILERVGVSDFLNCIGVTTSNAERSGRSRLGRTFASLLNHTLGFLAPTTLHAAHGGLGGKVKSFSPFGAVDPLTGLVIGPDIAVAATALEENIGAAASDGTNYLVTFSNRNGAGQQTPAAQLVSATGSLIGGQIVPIGATGEPPTVAFDGTNYLLAWRTSVGNALVGQFVSRTGALVGATFTIATTGPPNPSTLVFGGGTYLMVYTRQIDPNLGDFGYRTFARTISVAGVLGGQLQVGSVLGNDGFNNAAFDGANFFVVYTDGTIIRGRFISPAGVLGFENTIVNAQNMAFTTPLAFNGTNYLIAFSTGQPFTDAFAQLYSPVNTGAIVGGRINIANNSGDHELPVNVTASGSNFVVSFIDGLNAIGKATIKARVISGSGSTRLPAFTVAAPRDGKVAAGFVANFNGLKYLAILVRGIQTSATEPLDLETWAQKDFFSSLLTIPIPP